MCLKSANLQHIRQWAQTVTLRSLQLYCVNLQTKGNVEILILSDKFSLNL